MKRSLTLSLLLLLTAVSFSQVKKTYFDNGKLKSVGEYVNGEKNGTWKVYYESGQLRSIMNFENGERNGEFKSYHENGELSIIGLQEKGMNIGKWKYYDEDGDIQVIQEDIKNTDSLLSKTYHKNGQLYSIEYSVNFKLSGESKYYFDNGTLFKSGNYKKGKEIGEWKYYYQNGKLRLIGKYDQGKPIGTWKTYHENGTLASTGEYEGGKRTGIWKNYHENQQLAMEGVYIENNANGEWRIYYDNGNIYQVRLWDKGKLMDLIQCKDRNGNNLDKGSLINGYGSVHYYNKKGKVDFTQVYEEGIVITDAEKRVFKDTLSHQLDGKYRNNTHFSSEIENFNRNNFVLEYNFSTSVYDDQWTLVLGKSYRVLGLKLNKDHSMNLTLNNQRQVVPIDFEYELNKSYSLIISYNKSTVRVYIDNELVSTTKTELTPTWPKSDYNISSCNYSVANCFKGTISNLNIYSP